MAASRATTLQGDEKAVVLLAHNYVNAAQTGKGTSADIAPENSQGLETMTVSASEGRVEVDGAEKSELVDGAESSKAMVEEKIGGGANVCGENVQLPMRLVVLSS